MSEYKNPDLLFTPQQLHARLGDPKLCIIDARPTHEYAAGHIPGAVHLDLFGISLINTHPVAFDAFMAIFPPLLGSRGVGLEKTVVWYENTSEVRAARGFWICEYLGHEDVHVLDGGLKAWREAGYAVTTACAVPEAARFNARPVDVRHIGVGELHRRLGEVVALDTRGDGEYYGEVVRAARGGAIPGAVHIEYVDNLDAAGRYKPADELRAMYEVAGVAPEKEIVPY